MLKMRFLYTHEDTEVEKNTVICLLVTITNKLYQQKNIK